MRAVDELRCHQPALDRTEWKDASDDEQRERDEEMHPYRRRDSDLEPDEDKDKREGDEAQREEGGAIVGRREAIIEAAPGAAIDELQPAAKRLLRSQQDSCRHPIGDLVRVQGFVSTDSAMN